MPRGGPAENERGAGRVDGICEGLCAGRVEGICEGLCAGRVDGVVGVTGRVDGRFAGVVGRVTGRAAGAAGLVIGSWIMG
jgi:hypothetical protein